MGHGNVISEPKHCGIDQGMRGQEAVNQARADSEHSPKQGATLFTIQLGLNLIWMPLFFGLKRPIEATADIVALTGTVGYLTYVWSQVDTVAAWVSNTFLMQKALVLTICRLSHHIWLG